MNRKTVARKVERCRVAGAWRGSTALLAKPFARFCLNCHLLRGRKCLMLPILNACFALQLPVLQNNRKVSRCCCNCLRELANFERAVTFFSPEACFGLKFSKNSLFLRRRPVSLDCIRHHPVLRNRKSLRRLGIGRFCKDFRPGIVPLFRSPVTLAVLRPLWPPSKNSVPHGRVFDARSRSAVEIFGVWAAKSDVSNPVSNYCGFNPRASNCRLHSGGASPMPRGGRPSTAARTRSGARNASDMVMVT
jgi:hypothetical protein